jgi:hypothetical protein
VTHDYLVFLQGVAATGAWVSGLFFLRFWRDSRDPLFAFFGAAFWLLGSTWALLGLTNPTEDARPYIYSLRLLAFMLIIIGMIVKNRETRS